MQLVIVSTMSGAPWGGSEELWASVARAAMTDGHRVTVSASSNGMSAPRIEELKRLGARILLRGTENGRGIRNRLGRRLFGPLSVRHFQKLAHASADVVLVSQGGSYQFLRTAGLREYTGQLRIPYIVVCHSNTDGSELTGVERSDSAEYFRRAREVWFVAEETRACVERQLATRLPNARVVRNPTNLQSFETCEWPESESARLAAVGRVEVAKGIDLLCEALGSKKWRERRWMLSLYGEDRGRGYFQDLVRLYGIADRVRFAGHVSDVRSIWRDNHLLVLPSRRESAPLALVESMICGRPSVVTDVGGVREWVDDAASGFVAAQASARHLDAALERAWAARADWRTMGQAAHLKASSMVPRDAGRELLPSIVGLADAWQGAGFVQCRGACDTRRAESEVGFAQ